MTYAQFVSKSPHESVHNDLVAFLKAKFAMLCYEGFFAMKDALSWKFCLTSFEKMAYFCVSSWRRVFHHYYDIQTPRKSAEPQIFACLADTLILAKPMHSAGIIRVSEW